MHVRVLYQLYMYNKEMEREYALVKNRENTKMIKLMTYGSLSLVVISSRYFINLALQSNSKCSISSIPPDGNKPWATPGKSAALAPHSSAFTLHPY